MKQTLSFEKAVARLEELVARMEDPAVTLEESMVLFEEGVRVAEYCDKQLENARQKVAVLSASLEPSEEQEGNL